jgi:hypothetical protein
VFSCLSTFSLLLHGKPSLLNVGHFLTKDE